MREGLFTKTSRVTAAMLCALQGSAAQYLGKATPQKRICITPFTLRLAVISGTWLTSSFASRGNEPLSGFARKFADKMATSELLQLDKYGFSYKFPLKSA